MVTFAIGALLHLFALATLSCSITLVVVLRPVGVLCKRVSNYPLGETGSYISAISAEICASPLN